MIIDRFSIWCHKKMHVIWLFLLCFVGNSAKWRGREILCRLWHSSKEKNLGRIIMWHMGEKRQGGRRGARASYCLTHTSMSLLSCMCSVKNTHPPPLAPFVDSFERDNKHQMGAKCTWWEYIKTWWPDSAGEGKAIVLDNKDNTNEISVLPSDDDLWVALYALTPVSATNGPFLDRQQTTHALP